MVRSNWKGNKDPSGVLGYDGLLQLVSQAGELLTFFVWQRLLNVLSSEGSAAETPQLWACGWGLQILCEGFRRHNIQNLCSYEYRITWKKQIIVFVINISHFLNQSLLCCNVISIVQPKWEISFPFTLMGNRVQIFLLAPNNTKRTSPTPFWIRKLKYPKSTPNKARVQPVKPAPKYCHTTVYLDCTRTAGCGYFSAKAKTKQSDIASSAGKVSSPKTQLWNVFDGAAHRRDTHKTSEATSWSCCCLTVHWGPQGQPERCNAI